MKLIPKLLLAALVIAMLLPFTILKKDDGTTLLSFSDFEWPDFSPPSLPELPSADSITDSVGVDGGQNTIYEWHDSEGSIQFSNEPPPQGVEFKMLRFDPDANVIQSVKLPSGEPEPTADEIPQPKTSDVEEVPNPYSSEGVKKLMDDARNVEKLLNQRFQNQQSAIDQ